MRAWGLLITTANLPVLPTRNTRGGSTISSVRGAGEMGGFLLLDQYTKSLFATCGFDLAYSLAQNKPPFSHCIQQHGPLPLAWL